ncbi:MAG: alpha/beta hydrolase family protein [Mangrovibacterium sp.]
MTRILLPLLAWTLLLCSCTNTPDAYWKSTFNEELIACNISTSEHPLLDAEGKVMTVVYLSNLISENISTISNSKNVAWLLAQGYRVVEMDYKQHPQTTSPHINAEIIAINDSIAASNFAGLTDCSHYRSYVLFEGYRLKRDVPYYVDDPTVYNCPSEYTVGDSLYMDIIYPEKPKHEVPMLLSFSYSNSSATFDKETQQLTNANKHQRLKQSYTLAGFNDSFLEGAPARGMAWAIADHPKYCLWGKGKTADSPNDAYKSFQCNPDAVRKVKSAVRTLRAEGVHLGLSGAIGIYGFSRGSTAGSLAVGRKQVHEFEDGFFLDVNDEVQAAALGSGVFNYTIIYDVSDDGDKQLELRCPWVWGELSDNRKRWEQMGAEYLADDSLTAPVLFFYNSTDEAYYQRQIAHFKHKLDSLGVPTSTLIDYGTGHSVPQTPESLQVLYDFFGQLKN